MIGPKMPGDGQRVLGLVEFRRLKSQRKGPDRAVGQPLHDPRHQGGIYSSRQKRPQRYICDHLFADRLAQ